MTTRMTTGYFNPTSQSSSNIDVDELDKRYLQKSGGTISNTLLVNGSVDIQTFLTIPNIGNVENAIEGKQSTINDGDLSIAKTNGLDTALSNKQDTIDTDTDLTAKNLTLTNDLVVGTTNIITELNNKQDDIDNTTDLTSKSLTTTDLNVEGRIDIDTTLYFDIWL